MQDNKNDAALDHIHEPQSPDEHTIADMSDDEVTAFGKKVKDFMAQKRQGASRAGRSRS
jgi:hypothetical protein